MTLECAHIEGKLTEKIQVEVDVNENTSYTSPAKPKPNSHQPQLNPTSTTTTHNLTALIYTAHPSSTTQPKPHQISLSPSNTPNPSLPPTTHTSRGAAVEFLTSESVDPPFYSHLWGVQIGQCKEYGFHWRLRGALTIHVDWDWKPSRLKFCCF